MSAQDLFFAAVHIYAAKAPWPVGRDHAVIEAVAIAREIAQEVSRPPTVLKIAK